MRLFFSGLNDSLTLVAFRFKTAPTVMKAIGLLFVLLSFGAIWLSTRTITLIRSIMTVQLPDNPSAATAQELQSFIAVYLQMYTTGDMDLFVSVAVALLLGSIIFVPFSGYVIHGVVSHSEMVIVKNGDNYKIGDSVMFQVISSFTLIQLVGLTVVAQLLTFDAANPSYAVVFTWGVWVTMTLITVFFSWVVEYMARKFGPRMRVMFLSIFALAIILLLLVDPNHGSTLFGASGIIFDFLNQLATGDTTLLISSLTILAGISVSFIYLLTFMASQAIQLAEPRTISKTDEKQFNSSDKPLNPFVMFWHLLFRYKTVTKPVTTALIFSAALVILLKGQTGLTTTMIVLPLAVAVSFGANIFGLVSGAANWLLSIEGWRRKMFHSAALVIFTAVAGVYVIAYGLGFITRTVTIEDLMETAPSLIALTFTTTAVSMAFSAKRPLPFSGKTRENLISSPTALIGYVTIFLLVTGTVGNIVSYAPPGSDWTLAATTVLVTSISYYLMYRKWMLTEEYTGRVLKETINAG